MNETTKLFTLESANRGSSAHSKREPAASLSSFGSGSCLKLEREGKTCFYSNSVENKECR